MDSADRRLARRARLQRGVFTFQDAAACDVSRSTVNRRLAAGDYVTLFPGVMRHDFTPDTREARLLAALLYVGGEAALARETAADVHVLRGAGAADRIHVLVHTRTFTEPGFCAAVKVHRTRYLEPSHVTTRDGLSVTSVERTICDLAHRRPYAALRRMIGHAVRTERASADSLRACIEGLGRFRGKRKLVMLLDELSPLEEHTAEELEALFLRVVRPRGLEPTALNHPVRDLSGRRRYLDAVYLPERLPVELDSRLEHGTLLDWHDDLRRENAIILGDGWFPPLRYSWNDLTRHPAAVCDQIRRTLEAIRTGTARPLPSVE